ncbi:expressed unknown protein [Seminavis robusta]|uniref:Carboxymuconolactone decarboxylase-like domain-containing protein n=1 Tax=Seminavis robusta TaxID=568900 RepID=A0A9N8H9F1_9STRA|nr:expressed unknown protein [Seminavis robusta]|eukprot:Sro204_g085760.1 n/a (415) ;mRNA; r:7477-8721
MSTAFAPMSSPLEPMNVVQAEKLTRKSIKKYFPLGPIMAKGNSNPITLHSVNEEVFPRLWSLMAEVMVVEGELPRSVKEEIALLVSTKNHCPMCCTAHRMMGTAAKRAEKTKDQEKIARQEALFKAAMAYAEKLIEDTMNAQPDQDLNGYDSVMEICSTNLAPASKTLEEEQDQGPLTAAGKAEVAMVVVLYFHMNRIISAVLGEQMSAAMFSVPEGAAKKMESRSVMSVVNKMMAPVLSGGMKAKRKPGITSSLFPEGSSCLEFLPEHLKGAELAGEERANALSRLYVWSVIYEQQLVNEGIMTPEILAVLDDPENCPPPRMRTHQIAHWATVEMRHVVGELEGETSRAIANVLLLVSYTPQSVFNSIHWKTLNKALGGPTSKALAIWWSLRLTFKKSQGLRSPLDLSAGSGW